MEKTIQYTVLAKQDGLKVKTLLQKQFQLSRREISRLKFSHGIYNNGKEVPVTAMVHTGDQLVLTFMERDMAKRARLIGKPDILYEDEDMVIVHKPSFMPSHPSHKHQDDDMGTLLYNYYNGNFVIRAIGRLDKDVSGIMVYAKSRIAASKLSTLRDQNKLKKTYYALVEGHFEKDEDTLTYDLAKVEGDKQRHIQKHGKPCITHYKTVLKSRHFSLLEIQIETGRTHQIRSGLAHFGHPIVGDSLYGSHFLQLNQIGLHCGRLLVEQPFTHQSFVLEDPLPKDMQEILNRDS